LSDRSRKHVWVEGLVQGVFFRAETQRTARHLGLSGWIRNLPDGRVEAVFEGPDEAVEAAVDWCHEGPEHAVVESVESVKEPPEGLSKFSVRH